MGAKGTAIGFIALVLIVTAKSSFFIIDPGKQAIITQFGKPIGEPKTKPGITFKTPFLQKVIFVDKRIHQIAE